MSSSAALEVASFYALASAAHVPFLPEEAALLCQKVENRVAGAPCGVMDPMTSCLGRKGRLLELLCQPAEVLGHSELPDDLAVFGIDSGVRHAVTGADYKTVRTAAFMGYRILAHALGARVCDGDGAGFVQLANAPFRGHLANACPSDIGPELLELLPQQLSGKDFLAVYGGTTDPLTRVEAARAYPVRAATLHPIHEHHRVRAFAELLRAPGSARRCHVLGELFYQAHASYSACGLGSAATDQLVGLARQAGTDSGIFGAKITGGGSGGTVAILAQPSGREAVEAIAESYLALTGRGGALFVGSSAGAAELGAALIPLPG